MSNKDRLKAERAYLQASYNVYARIEGRLTSDEYREKQRLDRAITAIDHQLATVERR